MSEKLCVFCVHLYWDQGGMYGDYPDPSRLVCRKNHLLLPDEGWGDGKFGPREQTVYDVADFREMIVKAKDCPDYEQVKA